jgi:Flp pilus assembly pilin Flp
MLAGLKREEGQGATEYAMVIGFLIVTLTLGIGLLGVGINDFLGDVADALPVVTP